MSTIIKVTNSASQVVSTNSKLIKTLIPAFKFRAPGFLFDPRYKRRIWDGFTWFMDKDGKFLTGLLPEVEMAIRNLGEEVTVEGHTDHDVWNDVVPDESMIAVHSHGADYALRDYQVEFIKRVKEHRRGIVEAATGAGKSAIMAGILSMVKKDFPILVMMRNKTLASQTYDNLKGFGIEDVGIVHGGKWDPNMVTICLFQSAQKMKELFPYIKVLIVDEVHESVGKQALEVYRALPSCFCRIGLSATPFKTNPIDQVHNYTVKGWFGPSLGKVSTSELQDRDILSKSNVMILTIDSPDEPGMMEMDYQTAYAKCVVENDYLHTTVAEIVDKLSGRTLIVVERIEHGDRLKQYIPNALWVQGSDDEATRKSIITALRESEGNVVAIATRIMSVGVDIFIHNLINCAGMKAEVSTIQRMGRGLRLSPDKEALDYYDFHFTMNKHLKNHARKRAKILADQGHIIKFV